MDKSLLTGHTLREVNALFIGYNVAVAPRVGGGEGNRANFCRVGAPGL